ncbi:short-chain dehydrogenase/reductase SDR [Spiroplasma syrphidicola EA-1]|uniref:Short-chain dehydrogenase/reductase SDR n=1 Tax=Spiroplasma syrphidicola EA-1 TaxID=1276229 RepID=R4UJ23_9MOLU|nr:SDR family oxidoreductase [Spiroplasma syrphidicola]AGM26125.1 short-chain dehydrogenase/reductase SDR [Spiroplasma syrphidicola EA-1]
MKTIVITGSTSGIGKATALYFAEQGYHVIATARNPEKDNLTNLNKNIKMYQMDVSDLNSINQAVDNIIKENEKIDILLNNAGYGLLAPFELTSEQDVKTIFNTNVFGLMEVTRAFLPIFKKQQAGTIISVSSIGGLVTMPLNSIYHATKYAVEGFTEGLSYELADFNINVKLIEPGGVKTNFFNAATVKEDQNNFPEYNPIIAKVRETFNAGMTEQESSYSTPLEVAQAIFTAVNDYNPNKIHYVVGKGAQETYQAKKQLDDEEFIALINNRFGINKK